MNRAYVDGVKLGSLACVKGLHSCRTAARDRHKAPAILTTGPQDPYPLSCHKPNQCAALDSRQRGNRQQIPSCCAQPPHSTGRPRKHPAASGRKTAANAAAFTHTLALLSLKPGRNVCATHACNQAPALYPLALQPAAQRAIPVASTPNTHTQNTVALLHRIHCLCATFSLCSLTHTQKTRVARIKQHHFARTHQ